MKILLRFSFAIIILHVALDARSQTCNGTPVVTTGTHTNITSSSATLGGNVTNEGGGSCDVVETGAEWSTTSGGPYTRVLGSESGSGTFIVDVVGLPAGTRIYYRGYGKNENGNAGASIDFTGENDFYTHATQPAAHASSITATTVDNNEIYLQFPAASTITNAQGYIILMRANSNPNTNNLNDGSTPNGALDFLHLLNSTSATDYTVTGLTPNTTYHFTVIPYNRSVHDDTYNYLTSAGYPFANATTESDVDVDAITGGLAATATPLSSSSTNVALMGFTLDASGPMTFQGVVFALSSTTAGKFSNFRLCESTNATYDGVVTDAPLSGVTITPSATELSITLSEALTATPNRNFFLVADVAATVSASTPSVQFSYDETDFTFAPGNLSGTGNQSRAYTFVDVTPPTLVSTIPADNATGVDFNLNKLVLTFNEDIANITTAAGSAADRVIIYDDATDVAVVTVDRGDITIVGTTVAEVTIPAGLLQPNSDYYVLIGNAVIEDVPADNDWPGIPSTSTWNFSTSGVLVNNATSNICSGSFQAISDIVISEVAAGDFITSGVINLDFAGADFGYDISSVTVSAGPAGNTDITAIQLNPKTLSRLTLNYTLDGTNDKIDVITISGLKIYASSPGTTTIVNGNSVAGVWAANAPVTFATIDVGTTTPPMPVLETSPPQDLLYCANEDISSATVAVVNDPGTYNWYANASLSTLLVSGYQVNVQDLGINSSVIGSMKRYVVRVDGCQSQALEVEFVVAPIPVADAGPASVDVCSGSSVVLGGSPTLIGPSVSGVYQYEWSTTAPTGFTNLGPNPTIFPTSPTDVTYSYTVRIIDANGCISDILDPNATILVNVDSTDEGIVYKSPLSTTFTLNSDPIKLEAEPSINSTYAGNGIYLSNGNYYFDPDFAGTAGSPHTITYTTELTNGCVVTDTRNFSVSNSSGSIINLANSYCQNELADPSDVLSLGPEWSNYLAQDNAYYSANYGYTYEFYDFQTYIGSNTPGTGVVGATNQYINPQILQPYAGGNYAYVGMRVRRRYQETFLGIPTGNWVYDPPIFWMIQYVNIYQTPALKVRGINEGQVVCDVNEWIEIEANYESGTYQISRDGVNWEAGPTVGLIDNPINSGKAKLNPHDAYLSTAFAAPNNVPATGVSRFYIRYIYTVPGTSGSTSSACQASLDISFYISNNPSVAFLPFTQTEFCYEAANYTFKTNGRNPGEYDIITGYGVFDNGDGSAVFDADEALKAKAFGTNSAPYTNYNIAEDVIIMARRTDGNGCQTTITQTVKARPLFPASFTEADLNVCYEDAAQDIVGGQPNGSFTLWHPKVSQTFSQTSIDDFLLRDYFDQAVAAGADSTVMQQFNLTLSTSDPVLGCGNSVTKVFTVNPPVEMNIIGLTPGMIVCGNGTGISFQGNWTGAGSFEISSTSPTSGFVPEAYGLDNTTAGNAVFTPSGAALPPGSPQKSYYIRYTYPTPGCVVPATTTEHLIINPQPAITFANSIPPANTAYCYENGTNPTTLALATNQNTNVTFSGFGVTDNSGGTATFNPTAGYQQSSLAANFNPPTDTTTRTILITAVRKDAQNCSNSASITYVVNPLPAANFDPQKEHCYEDAPVTLVGAQGNVTYQFIYKNTTTPANYTTAATPGPTYNFDPSDFFDDAVAKGANALATLQFDAIYTSISSKTGCINQLPPVTLSVSPYLPGEMAGITDGDIYCSNISDKEITFTPANGSFKIDNGTPFTPEGGKFLFDPPIALPAGGKEYVFTYSVTTGSNCISTQTKKVRVLPSPRAIFTVSAQCEGETIPYHAEASTNLSSSTYTWTFSGESKTGQDVEHRFPGVSSYYAKLKVEHPPFVVDANTTLVCADSLQLDQIVGPYPKDIEFSFYNVCEGDDTNFEVSSTFPINRVSWDFGDGESTGFGILSENISDPSLPKTSGLYEKPIHRYVGSYDALTVRVEGKTSDQFGGCPFMYEREISILKKWQPTAGQLYYDMSELENGKGFWVEEDRQGNATWEFDTPSKPIINSNLAAWVTGPTEPYKGNDISYVNSPCFDLSDFSRPVISIQHWTDTEPSDGAVLQYSIDGGFTWSRLGDVASGLDWYNRLTISSNPGEQIDLSSGWSLNTQRDWAVGKHALDVLPQDQRDKVRFRVAFASFNNREQRDGFAFNNVVIEERNRTILVESFTNTGATVNNNAFKEFRAADDGSFNTAELVKLQYHHAPAIPNGTKDALHNVNPVDQNARAAFYGVTSPYRAFVDGGFGQSSPLATFASSDLDLYFSLRSLVSSPVGISVELQDEPSDRLNVKATVQATNEVGLPGEYNVFIAIAERAVDEQIYVLRKFLPDASGTPLTSLTETDPAQEINVSYDMRHVTRKSNGEFADFVVIVFVQNLQTKDVLQTIMRPGAPVSSDVVTGVETSFESSIRVYPNPADEVMNIVLPRPASVETPVRIYDTFGREVYSGIIGTGEHSEAVPTKALSSGVYLIQVSTPQGLIQRKAMVAHE